MSTRSPFAYGPSGRLLTSTAGHEVFCCNGDDEAPHFVHAMDGTVTGVRNVHGGVLACDETGSLVLILVPEGSEAWRLQLGVQPSALAATESGHWAAVHDMGIVYGHGPKHLGEINLQSATAAVFRDDHTLAIVGSGGQLEIRDLQTNGRKTVELGSPCVAVAWSALGWWLVASEQGVHRVEADGSAALRYLKWSGKPISALAASKAGGLCAFVTEEHYVCVFGVVRDINCGAIVYPERVAYEVEFGPGNMLGIGIGMGDGNKIDLTRSGGVARTDPPPGRPINRWLLQVGHDPADVEQALQLEREYVAGRIRFEGSTMITVPAAEAQPREAKAAEPSRGAAQPSGGSPWVWVVLAILISGLALVLLL